MSLTVPPILIPLALLALAFACWRYCLSPLIWTTQMNTGCTHKQAVLELVGTPLVSIALMGAVLHVTGNDAILSATIQGLTWCGRGLVWDVLHPFAYGFGISFS